MKRFTEITIFALFSVSLGGAIEDGSLWGTVIIGAIVALLIWGYVMEGPSK